MILSSNKFTPLPPIMEAICWRAIRELQPESDAIDENIEAVDGEEWDVLTEQIAFDSNEDILNQMEFNIQSYSGINGEIYGIRCGVHTLQLAISDALKIHEKSLAIIRKVVKELRSTTNIQILKMLN